MKTEEQIKNEILREAIKETNVDVVEALIELGCSKNEVLVLAVNNRNVKMVDFSIKLGADVNGSGCLSWIVSDNSAEALAIAKLLLENGASVEGELLSEVQGIKMAKLLLSFGADVNEKIILYADSFTFPLHRIVYYEDNIKLAEFFIKNGANIEAKDSEGRTPLFIAYIEKFFPMFRILIENGADITVTDKHRRDISWHYPSSRKFRQLIRAEFQRVEDSLSVEEKYRRREIKRQEELERVRECELRQKELEEEARLRQIKEDERRVQEEIAKLEAWKVEEGIKFQINNSIAEIISRKKEMV